MILSSKFDEFKPEIDALVKDGYSVVSEIREDYDRNLGLVLSKDGKKFSLMFVEDFHAPDESVFYGKVDVRISPWSKRIRGVE
jgi:hypothetical protein